MKVFASPSRYIQGKDALFQSIEHIKSLGQTPLILCDDVVYNIVGERFLSYLQDDLLPHRVSLTEKHLIMKSIVSLLLRKKRIVTLLLDLVVEKLLTLQRQLQIKLIYQWSLHQQ